MPEPFFFPGVTLLVTVYNRSRSLERLLGAFEQLGCRFEDIVVSDDGSKPEQLEQIKAVRDKYPFRLITTPQNKGLGNNLNKGQDAVTTPYTLYVQEDFVPQSVFPARMQQALQYMNERQDLDMVRFYAYFKYPYLKPIKDGFSEMKFNWLVPNFRQFYMYSDHPHLRRSNFFEKFGRYTEGIKSDKTEYRMMMSFLQKKGKALYHEDHYGNFEQVNSSDEPSMVKRAKWRENQNFFLNMLRYVYKHVKFRYHYLTLK